MKCYGIQGRGPLSRVKTDAAADRKQQRQEDINRVRLANRAIDLQARNPNWRNARNLSRQDEAALPRHRLEMPLLRDNCAYSALVY